MDAKRNFSKSIVFNSFLSGFLLICVVLYGGFEVYFRYFADGEKLFKSGLNAQGEGDDVLAQIYYKLAIKAKNKAAMKQLIKIYRQQDLPYKAAHLYNHLYIRGVKSALIEAGDLFVKPQDMPTAEKYYLKAAKFDNNFEGVRKLVKLYVKEKNTVGLERITNFITGSKNVDAIAFLALTIRLDGDYKEAERLYKLTEQLGSEKYLKNLAVTLFEQKKYQEALSYCQKYFTVKKQGHFIILIAAECAAKLGDYDLTMKFYRQSLTLSEKKSPKPKRGTNISLLSALINVAINTKHVAELEKELEGKGFRENIALAYMFDKLNNFPKAKKYFDKVLSIKSGVIAVANFYKVSEDYLEAIKWYKKAKKAGVLDLDFDIALCYQKLENYPEAEKYYNLAVKESHINVFLIIHMAEYFKMRNEQQKAEKYYKIALEHLLAQIKNKDFSDYQLVEIAEIYCKLRQYDKAIRQLQFIEKDYINKGQRHLKDSVIEQYRIIYAAKAKFNFKNKN